MEATSSIGFGQLAWHEMLSECRGRHPMGARRRQIKTSCSCGKPGWGHQTSIDARATAPWSSRLDTVGVNHCQSYEYEGFLNWYTDILTLSVYSIHIAYICIYMLIYLYVYLYSWNLGRVYNRLYRGEKQCESLASRSVWHLRCKLDQCRREARHPRGFQEANRCNCPLCSTWIKA